MRALAVAAAAAAASATAVTRPVELLAANPVAGCPALKAPRSAPDDVALLRPVHVKLMGAMGDSITAGFAISNLPTESRDKVYSTGDAANATTMLNFLRRYEAAGVDPVNVAVSGDVSAGMTKQATRLVAGIKAAQGVDPAADWKMVTLWIGANNQCPSCKGAAGNQPPAYRADLKAALDVLKAGLPRTLVNLVQMLPLSTLATADGVDAHCKAEHIITRVECHCAFSSANDSAAMDHVTQQDNAALIDLAKEYAGAKDFAVVVQPGLSGMTIPDWTYLSRFDCFHPSLLAHQQIALGLWKNLFEPVGAKTTAFQLPVATYCPTDDDLIHS